MQKLQMVNIVTAETVDQRKKLEDLNDRLDLLMQKLMKNERQWETIMMMQVSFTRL